MRISSAVTVAPSTIGVSLLALDVADACDVGNDPEVFVDGCSRIVRTVSSLFLFFFLGLARMYVIKKMNAMQKIKAMASSIIINVKMKTVSSPN